MILFDAKQLSPIVLLMSQVQRDYPIWDIWAGGITVKSCRMDFLWRFISPTLERAAVKPGLNEIINLQLPALWAWREVYYKFHKRQPDGGQTGKSGLESLDEGVIWPPLCHIWETAALQRMDRAGAGPRWSYTVYRKRKEAIKVKTVRESQ